MGSLPGALWPADLTLVLHFGHILEVTDPTLLWLPCQSQDKQLALLSVTSQTSQLPSPQRNMMFATRSLGQRYSELVTTAGCAAPALLVSVSLFHTNPPLRHCLRAAAKSLGCLALIQAKGTAGSTSWPQGPGMLVCHICVVPCSRREDGGGVPASAGELRRLGGAGRAPCGQPVWRAEESSGLCADDNVLVIPSHTWEVGAGPHPRGPASPGGRERRLGREIVTWWGLWGRGQAVFCCCFELRGCPWS